LTAAQARRILKRVFGSTMRREKSNYVIQAVSHALDVLEQFRDHDEELGVTELSKRLKLHKNNVFRLLATLESRGYIEQNHATENYRLGVRCLQLGRSYVEQMGLLPQAHSVIGTLSRETRETAFLAVLRGGAAIAIDVAEADRAVRIASPLGDLLPLHCTAAGKALLAFEPEDDVKALVPEQLPRFTERTPGDRQTLQGQLKTVASTGYAIDMGEHADDVRGVAAPVRDYTRAVIGALTVVGPAYRFQVERLEKELAPVVVRAARDLSSRLGFDLGTRREAQA
jgi:DNA-binding IclR family transcriptional regulator